jgi:hypothetical protein
MRFIHLGIIDHRALFYYLVILIILNANHGCVLYPNYLHVFSLATINNSEKKRERPVFYIFTCQNDTCKSLQVLPKNPNDSFSLCLWQWKIPTKSVPDSKIACFNYILIKVWFVSISANEASESLVLNHIRYIIKTIV